MNLADLVGFDYAQAIRELNQELSYEQIAKKIGYKDKNSISRIYNGSIPSHIHGEALYALYRDTFGRKPAYNPPKSTFTPLHSP